jgi:signal transduction histidine kinase
MFSTRDSARRGEPLAVAVMVTLRDEVPAALAAEPEDALKMGIPLYFRISSALKRIIGRDLITNEFVAIFELVKNAFDARARRVDVVFVSDRLFIIDNGKGMSLRDIDDKWLFVAYSAKRDGTEDGSDYRNRIGGGAAYAGSKGVGRFSCDRLGATLRMQTRQTGRSNSVEVVTVDWDLFEQSAKEEFASVPVTHERLADFELPQGSRGLESGTALEVGSLREPWGRDKFLRLRAALAKLINPFGETSDTFEVNLRVPGEDEADAEVLAKAVFPKDDQLKIVNGPIHNFIFETLKEKTTHLEVWISDDGDYLYSTLEDRGELIYRIREPNEYSLLAGSGFSCNLFFLNRSAKATFARRMGVNSVEFGSIFLFKNGFRVFPVGEEGVDTFSIDRRKQQGYARFLGTRDIIGRIDVVGSDELFREATSRNQGLIDTPAYRELLDCFDGKCFRRLERYVVGVNWKDSLDLTTEDTSRLRGDTASARITAIVAQLAGTKGVELLGYNHELVRILNERSDEFEGSLVALRVLAENSGDSSFMQELEAASTRFRELQRAEAAARQTADRERVARRQAERQATDAVQRFEEERKRNLFLTSITSLDKETIEILHHQIIIHASAVNEIINGQFDALRRGTVPTQDALLTVFENIAFQNKKVLSIARFATKANFRLDSEAIQEDLAAYITQYIDRVAPIFAETGIRISVESSAKGLVRTFKPIEVSILIDNLVSNAGKSDADEIKFMIEETTRQQRLGGVTRELKLTVQDDGIGFSPDIADLTRLFEKGFTTSTGSGLGLYHVAQILDDLGGSIVAERAPVGAKFLIRIKG